MSRIRAIHPRAPQDDDVASMSLAARYLWAYLPCYADREGRLEDRPLMLKGEVFPADAVDVSALLDEMAAPERGFIIRYRAPNGRRLIQIVSFARYQKPHHRERPSVLPPPDGWTTVGQSPGECGSIDDESDCGPGESASFGEESDNGRSGSPDLRISGSPVDPPKAPQGGQAELKLVPDGDQSGGKEADAIRAVFAHYRTHRPRSYRDPQPTAKEWRQIKARLRDGITVEELCQAIDGYMADPWSQGQNDRGTKYDGLDLITRDEAHVRRGIGFLTSPRSPPRDPQRGFARATTEQPTVTGRVPLP